MEEKDKKPKIRFKGFTDSWEQRKLGEIGKAVSGIGFPEKEQGGTEGVPFYKVSDMNNEGNEHEMIFANNYVSKEQINKNNWKVIDDVPSILFAKVGAAVMLNRKRLVRFPFLLDNNSMTYIYEKKEMNPEFSKSLFETIYLPSLVQVGALPSYNANQVEEIEINIPNIKEQEQIGKLFDNIDNLITLHQRKYDKLLCVKKSMLEKMFPKNGCDVPEIRFKGFNEAWEQRKLGEIYRFQYGEFNNNPSNGGIYPVYGANGIIGGYTKYNTEDSVVIGHMGEYAGSVLWGNGKHFVTYNGTISKPKVDFINSKFGYYMLYQKDINKICGGSGLPFLSYEQLDKIEVSYPKDIEEQIQISKCLTNIDNLITLHQRKLDKLKDVKKSLLENMFV